MAYEPHFEISPRLLTLVEAVAALRERIQGAAVELSWIPALQKDARTRNVHASTAIEGNPLTLEEVRALEEGSDAVLPEALARREVLNDFAGLRYVELHAGAETIRHDDVFALHSILAAGVMDQGEAGRYRTIQVQVGGYMPPGSTTPAARTSARRRRRARAAGTRPPAPGSCGSARPRPGPSRRRRGCCAARRRRRGE